VLFRNYWLPEQPPATGDEEWRLSDIDHFDQLSSMVNRMYGLKSCILGLCDRDTPFDRGLN
jgi:hypothetical protein